LVGKQHGFLSECISRGGKLFKLIEIVVIEVNPQALEVNAASENKWRHYKSELEKTKENLNHYVKSISHDIMVPIGKKALLRGKLIHTNEVTVAHGSSYFSECSTAQAIEIIEKRLLNCDQQLTALEKEKELFS
jgi:unconventional prefoldin RPB5 interactor 1